MSRERILVCGSRDWRHYGQVRERLSESTSALIIHGGAQGADMMAQRACEEHNVHTAVVKPLWDAFGKRAGYLRNLAMLDLEPDLVLAFSTGSRGTQHTIDEARKRGISVEVIGQELEPEQEKHKDQKQDPDLSQDQEDNSPEQVV